MTAAVARQHPLDRTVSSRRLICTPAEAATLFDNGFDPSGLVYAWRESYLQISCSLRPYEMKRGLTSRVCVRVASPFDSGISMGLSVPAYYSFSGTASFRLSDYGETSSSSSSRNSIPTVHISGD